VSALTGVPVRANVAMTGEITLRGRVLPIGGLREKLLAALRAGYTDAILPADNRKDAKELSERITEGLRLHFVDNIGEVLRLALERMPEPRKITPEEAKYTPVEVPVAGTSIICAEEIL